VLLCSANWSAPIHLGRPVSIQLTGLQAIETVPPLTGLAPGEGYWTWTSAPVVASAGVPGYDAVTLGCGGSDDPGTPQCEVVGGGVLGNDYPDLVVTVNANGTTYTRTYNWASTPH